jgi:hypothetical protein
MTSYTSKIDSRIREIEQQIEVLQAELEDLRTASRVITLLGSDNENAAGHEPRRQPLNGGQPPRLADQILEILNRCGGLTVRELHRKLQASRSDLAVKTVSAILTRLKDDKRVVNANRVWTLRQKDDEPQPLRANGSVGNGHDLTHHAPFDLALAPHDEGERR